MTDGILNIDKPEGWTSHDVVAFTRRHLRVRRVGHAGTLDPIATGVLLVCVGQATRVAEYLMAGVKGYRAVIQLGLTTDTYDREGQVTGRAPVPDLSFEALAGVLAQFEGEIEQVPPAYSALKVQGVPAHRRARRGEQLELPPRSVRIHGVELLEWRSPNCTIQLTCDPGTYVRSLAHDLGARLGCGGVMMSLCRQRSGDFVLEEAISPELLAEAAAEGRAAALLHPISAALTDLLAVPVDAGQLEHLSHGRSIAAAGGPQPPLAYAVGPGGEVGAILRYDMDSGQWRPDKVFPLTSRAEN